MQNLLIVDDSVPFMNDVEFIMKDKYKILKAENGKKGLSILQQENINLVLLDLKLPDIHGLEILRKIHSEIDPLLPVIVITDYGNVETAVKAMQLGAADFIQKDFNRNVLNEKIAQAFEKRELSLRLHALEAEVDEDSDRFLVAGKAAKKVQLDIERFANQDVHILLTGETGVGKDAVAREIHLRSNRRDKLFMKVSLHALSESLIESELFGHERGAFSGADEAKIGRFEAADGGTVYLPEISEISEKIQLKLLEFMQYKKISKVGQRNLKDVRLNVRLVLASNRKLEQLVEQGKLREDFYYRIKVVNIDIPPLSERRDEIRPLVGYFLETLSARFNKKGIGFSDEALKVVESYHWRGNVRELKNFMTNVIIRSGDNYSITADDLPGLAQPVSGERAGGATYQEALQHFQMEYFAGLLKRNGGRVSAAAEEAGMTRQGLHNILKKLDIDRNNS